MRQGISALNEAMANLTRRTQTVTSTSTIGNAGSTATVMGMLGSLGNVSTLVASSKVNAQTYTVWSSSAPLGLDVTSPESPSTISSTAEANTAPTSYGVVQTTFRKGGNTQTSLGNITGVYAGSGAAANATSLTLKITSPDATMGTNPISVSIEVTDQSGANLGTYSGLVAAGQSISLGANIGLSIAFTAGSMIRNTTTTFSVDKNTPTNINPNAVFNNADVNLRPRFENNAQVTAGAFTVNGVTVNVLANDTINSVLARINSTVSGVNATFSGDKVSIQTTGPSKDDIVLGNDTSGFLAALKLSGAVTAKGNVHDDQRVLAQTAQFGSVTSGAFEVNGVQISVNSTTDTLQSLLTRINSSGAGVTASYNSTTDKLSITANSPGAALTLGNDTSGFLTAAKLALEPTGTSFNPNAPFNGTGANAPMFEPGKDVNAGAFLVNGVSISVAANDTLNTVLARITASSAGVIAAYDPVTEKVSLTAKSPGPTPITVGSDTSGLLAAVKLDATAINTPGSSSLNSSLANSSVFAAVHNGAITINGQSVAVNPAANSLSQLISSINNLNGVSATLDSKSGKITLAAEQAGGDLDIEDTSGLFSALSLATGKITGTASTLQTVEETTTALDDPTSTANSIASAMRLVNEVLEQLQRAPQASQLFRHDVEYAVRRAFSSVASPSSAGLSLVETDGALQLNVDTDQLATILTDDPQALDEFLSSANNLPDAWEQLLSSYDDFSATTLSIQQIKAQTTNQQLPAALLGEKTKAEIIQVDSDRTLFLLESLQFSSLLKTEDSSLLLASEVPSAFTVDKAKQAYGLASQWESSLYARSQLGVTSFATR
jgi:hypothetical protein